MKFKEKRINKWDDLWKLYSQEFNDPKVPWIFRGHSKPNYRLETTIERIRRRYGIPFEDLPELEDCLVRHFKRQAHRHLTNLPEEDDILGWLGLMRHYGSPTRLMDWTYSFFVGLYFAVEEAEGNCVLWALDYDWFRKSAESRYRADVEYIVTPNDPRLKGREFFRRVFQKQPPVDLVGSVNPEKLNDRLIVQQGVFLAPANITRSFKKNFAKLQSDPVDASRVKKIIISTSSVELKKQITRHLHRMNINRATLFPGLDGFAVSLNTLLAMPDILRGRYPFEEKPPYT